MMLPKRPPASRDRNRVLEKTAPGELMVHLSISGIKKG
jgi:hypothetical protein